MRTRNRRKEGGQCRRATVAPLVAVMLVVLLGFASLAVDVGYIYGARGEMQRTADASALAGASALLLDSASVHDRAIGTAVQNSIYQDSMTPDELNVLIGHWGSHSQVFTESSVDDPVTPNAVHVTGTRQNMPLFFASLFGFNETDIQKEAIALLGSGRCAGVWGLEGITADGSIVTDSYDSSEGSYGSGSIHPNGDICSCQDIDVFGGIEIHGDAMYGDGFGFYPSGSSYEVWGVVDDHRCGVPSFDADYDGAAVDNDNATIGLTENGRDPFLGSPWDLYIEGNDSLTLAGGTYYFTSAMLAGQAFVNITGPTTIFVTGPADFGGGGLFNASQEPSDLVIYCSGPTVRLRGGSGFYGALVAPDSDVHLEGTGDYYGTLLARTLDMDGDAVIHVDETLVSYLFGIDPEAPVLVK
jgi:hypothetical protein